MYTYSNILTELASRTRNQVNNITNLRTLINSAVREEAASLSFNSLIKHTNTLRALYNSVYHYPLPADARSESIIDFVKYSNLNNPSYLNYKKVPLRQFNTNFNLDTFSFDYSNGVSWLLGNFTTNNSTKILSTMDSVTGNGTWSATDNATNIVTNTSNHISGTGSIEVDMAVAGTVLSIVNSTLTSVDLTNTDKLFYWVFLPSTDLPTSATLVYGSSGANYYTSTAITPFNTSTFVQGWNLVAFDAGTVTGAPDITNIDYIKCSLTFATIPATLEGFIFDNILGSIGDPMEIIYYSRYPWKTTANVWIQDSTSNEDTLNANPEEFRILLARIAFDAAKSIPMSDQDLVQLGKDYLNAKREYQLMYPSKVKKYRISY